MEQLDVDLQVVRIYRSLQCFKYEEAMIALERLLEEVPDHGVAHMLQAQVCVRLLDDPARAKLHYGFAIRFAPERVEPYHELAEVLDALGDTGALIELLAKAEATANVPRAPILLAVARTYERRGEWPEALQRYRQASCYAMEEAHIQACTEGIDRANMREHASRWSAYTNA